MTQSASASRALDQSERAKRRKWVRHVKDCIRLARRDRNDTHLVRGDDDLAEAIVDYSSVAQYGWTWPPDNLLAQVLNETDRNIRKRVARLRIAGLFVVIPPSEGWGTKRYIPVLDGRPLFDVALTSKGVRAAIAALRQDCGEPGTPVPPQGAAETGTPVPPEEEWAFQQGRNASSTESSSNNPQEGNSPSPYPTHAAAPGAPRREEGSLDLNLQDASSTALSEPTAPPAGSTTSAEKPTLPHRCPRRDEPQVRAEPDSAGKTATPIVEFGLVCLMRDYPHPAGEHGIEHEAYRGHARNAWRDLMPAQMHDAVRAAPNAPGKEWLGHWLNNGRKTGKFEVVEQRPVIQGVWVRKDTPQWDAWVDYYHAHGRRPQTVQHRVDGELQTGWMFQTERPAGPETAGRVGGMQ